MKPSPVHRLLVVVLVTAALCTTAHAGSFFRPTVTWQTTQHIKRQIAASSSPLPTDETLNHHNEPQQEPQQQREGPLFPQALIPSSAAAAAATTVSHSSATATASVASSSSSSTSAWSAELAIVAATIAPPTYLAGVLPGASDFSKCLCFESTGRWCHSSSNSNANSTSTNSSDNSSSSSGSGNAAASSTSSSAGEDDFDAFWDRDSCQNWLLDTFLWTIPALVFFFLCLFYPVVLFSARMCCNCCGGREPSEGCCCPARPPPVYLLDENTTPTKKAYGNREICITKTFFVALFALTVYYSVAVYVSNDDLHYGIIHVTNQVNAKTQGLVGAVLDAEHSFAALLANDTMRNETLQFTTEAIVSSFSASLQHAEAPLHRVAHSVHHAVEKIQFYESEQQYGRNQDAYRIPSMMLVLLFPLLFVCLCNCRGAVWTIASGLMAWVGVVVIVGFAFHTVLAETSTSLCDSYNTTLVPSVMNAAQWAGGCGSDLTTPLDNFFESYTNFLCNDSQKGVSYVGENSSTTVYGAFSVLCLSRFVDPIPLFNCSMEAFATVCPAQANQPPPSAASKADEGVLFWMYQFGNLTRLFTDSVPNGGAGCRSEDGCSSIESCAANCTNPDAKAAAGALVRSFRLSVPQMAPLALEFYPSYVNCSGINTALRSSDVYGELCHDLSTKLTNMALVFLALSGLSVVGVVILLLSAKRMTKMRLSSDAASTSTTSETSALLLSNTNNHNDNNNASMNSAVALQTVHQHQQQQYGPESLNRGEEGGYPHTQQTTTAPVYGTVIDVSTHQQQQQPAGMSRVTQLAVDVLFNGDRQQAESMFGTPIAFHSRADLERQLGYAPQQHQQQAAPTVSPQQGGGGGKTVA